MNVRTISKSLELTEAISNYIQKKIVPLEKLLKGLPPETLIEVEVGKDHKHHKGTGFRAEMSVKLSDKKLYAVAIEADLYAAIDKVKDEIIAEFKKNKSKKRDVRRSGASKIKKEIKNQ